MKTNSNENMLSYIVLKYFSLTFVPQSPEQYWQRNRDNPHQWFHNLKKGFMVEQNLFYL